MNTDFDVAQNIMIIEKLKAQLINQVADLYQNMLGCMPSDEARAEILADIVITVYLLSSKLGENIDSLDEKIVNKLRLGLLDESNKLHTEMSALIKRLSR